MPMAPRPFRLTPQVKRQEKSWASRRDEKRVVYQSPEWKALRRLVVVRDCYLCQKCLQEERYTVVTLDAERGTKEIPAIVDHIIPAKTADDVLCDESNLQTLCPTCANRKTAKEDGGFGNKKHG